MAAKNDNNDTNDDGNVIFDFETYEEFKRERLKLNYESTLKIWYSLPSELPSIDNQRIKGYTSRQQRVRLGKVSLFAVYCILFKRTFLRKRISSKGSRLWHQTLNISSLHDGTLFEIYQSVCRITSEFVDKAERYDSKINYDEIFKAGRLVWLMVAYQVQLKLPIVFSDSMLGYNMLYPYTDDLVDCNEVSREAKKDFAHLFYQRLLIGDSNYDSKSHFNGQQSNINELQLPSSLQPFADRVGKIFDMVKFIENDWVRNGEHRGVYMSLATIHECQMKSTLQHAPPGNNFTLTITDIEEISAQKGGASVMVTGFLIEGRTTRAKVAYLEFIGFGLQLIDDLQDVNEDMKNNHRTIFTQSIAEGRTLDAPTAHLIQYLYSTPPYVNLLDDDRTVSNAQNNMTLAHYIHDSMMTFGVLIILEAASHLQQYYSPEFYRELARRSPVTMKKLKRAHVEKHMWSVLRRHWF